MDDFEYKSKVLIHNMIKDMLVLVNKDGNKSGDKAYDILSGSCSFLINLTTNFLMKVVNGEARVELMELYLSELKKTLNKVTDGK